MTLVARIAALSLLTSGLVAALGLAVLTAFIGPGIPSSELVIPGLVLACVGGIIGAIAGTAREIVAAQRAPQPQSEELSTGTKRRLLRMAAALVVCFLCLVVMWFKVRSSVSVAATREVAQLEPPIDGSIPPEPGTADVPPPRIGQEQQDETGRQSEPAKPNSATTESLPEVIRPLLPTIVSVTQTYLSDEEPKPKRTSQAGVVFDPRGYILTLTLLDEYDNDGRQTKVRLGDQKEYVARVVENNQHLGLAILKVSVAQPIPAISLKNVPEPESRAMVFAVTFQPQTKPLKGRIGSTGVNFQIYLDQL